MTGEAFAVPGTWPPGVLPAEWITGQGVTVLRMATAGWISRPEDDPGSTLWPARIKGDVVLSQTAADAIGIGGRVALGISDIELWDGDDALADLIRFGGADGRNAMVRVVPAPSPGASDLGTPLSAAPVPFRGMVRSIVAIDGRGARLSLADIAERLAVPLQPTRYLGTGGLEGPAALAGRPKPVCLGRVFNAEPVALGNIDLGDGALPTYQTHWRAVAGHDAVRIRGVAQTAVGAAPGVGQYRDLPAVGAFQIGSSPDGPVTADVRGDAVPFYANTTTGVVRRLVQSLGPAMADAEIATDSFAFADADLPGEVGWCRGPQEIGAADAVGEMLAGCGAVLAGGRGGALRLFDPIAEAPAQFTIPAPWIATLQPLPLPATLRPAPRAVAVDWRRNRFPLSDLAGSVADADRAQLAGQASGPARAESATITLQVAQQRDLRLPGLYWAEADALARAERWRRWIEAGPRLFEVETDRYLGAIECGDVGRIAYPAYGLEGGALCTVVGWREALAGRRLTLVVATLPEG
jgi:hypothetical protein